MEGNTGLVIAAASFVGSHFILSHPLRAILVKRLGEGGFAGLYSLVALATFAWMVMAWRAVPLSPPYWVAGDVTWGIGTLVMWLASILMVGSFLGNPALPAPNAAALANRPPHGVFRITRHPMMWAFALWGLVHIAIAPRVDNLILSGAIIVLALLGARFQDWKKAMLMGDRWRKWERLTSFLPFARGFAWPGMVPLVGGTVLWLVATYLHAPLGSIPAGIWFWI